MSGVRESIGYHGAEHHAQLRGDEEFAWRAVPGHPMPDPALECEREANELLRHMERAQRAADDAVTYELALHCTWAAQSYAAEAAMWFAHAARLRERGAR